MKVPESDIQVIVGFDFISVGLISNVWNYKQYKKIWKEQDIVSIMRNQNPTR